MTRRVTTTRSTDAHDSTKELLKTAAERTGGRHRGGHAHDAAEAHLMPGPAPTHRARKARPTMPKM
jgi:hypothetical protein